MKDLFDAVKEAYSQSEPSPADGGWQKVSASIRRASVLRTLAWGGASIAACAAIVLLFVSVPGSRFDTVPESRTAEMTAPSPTLEVLPEDSTLSENEPQLIQPVTGHNLVALAQVKAADASSNSEDAYTEATEAVEVAETAEVIDDIETSCSVKDSSEVQQTVQSPVPNRDISPEEVQQPERWWEEAEPAPKNRRHMKVGVNASISPMSSAVSNVIMPQTDFLAVVKSNNFYYNSTASEKEFLFSNFSSLPTSVNYRHDIPLGLGIAINFPLTDKFSIETGLNYTYLHSVENNNGSLSDQRLHLAGIPVRAEYAIVLNNNFSIYAGAGASVEKCLKASLGKKTYNEKRLQYAAETFAGAELRLWKNTSLYLQPTLSYWLTDTDLITYRTENTLVFSVDAGLRFRL